MNILISNDDGYNAPGILTLKEHLDRFAKVTLVAPSKERSATGHSITIKNPLKVEKQADDLYIVSGTPTDCIKYSLLTLFKDNKPNLIVSGINKGGNIGDDVTYSGTVAVAMEGIIYGIPSIAVSLVTKFTTSHPNPEKEILHFDTAGKFVTKLIKTLDLTKFPKNTLLNINVPNLPYEKLKGISFSTLGNRTYEEKFTEEKNPFGETMHWFTATGRTFHDKDGSDSQAILNDKISISPLHLDLTNHAFLKTMRTSWNIEL